MTHEEEDGLQTGLGISRRSLLRRGAVVGGTLMWTAPMVRSMTPAAFAAQQGPSPGDCAACYCYSGPKSAPTKEASIDNGVVGERFSNDDCQAWCTHRDGSGAPGGPYENYEYCSGLAANGGCEAIKTTDSGYTPATPNNGVSCA